MIEPGSRRGESVQVRRLNMRVAQGADRVGTLIIREQDEDVRPVARAKSASINR